MKINYDSDYYCAGMTNYYCAGDFVESEMLLFIAVNSK